MIKLSKFGNIEILTPTCNLTTINDGRGGIFTWVPDDPLMEFNMLYFRPGKVRGNHHHPEFTEYFLIVDGSGIMITKDREGSEISMHASKGTCFKTPPNTTHTFVAITNVTCVAMLSKPWDDCETPIVHEELVPFDEEYTKYKKENLE